jgi:hypothetical protein
MCVTFNGVCVNKQSSQKIILRRHIQKSVSDFKKQSILFESRHNARGEAARLLIPGEREKTKPA